ncbi:MAG: hypothetical protein ACTTHG_01245 [Treponemataceae bacterium]
MKKHSKLYNIARFIYRYLRYNEHRPFSQPLYFLDNSKKHETCCFILSGYKEFTWDIVFKRIKEFCPSNIDVCIVSSGKYSEKLNNIAKKYDWSYLATKRNNVCLTLNTAIACFENCKNIFKLDEDIFVTKDFFKNLPDIYNESKKDYFPSFAAPLISINGYGYRRILEKLNMVEEYSNKFEYPKISAGDHMKIENDIDVAKYMWSKNIDDTDNKIKQIVSKQNFTVCPIRFSIGAIYFEKELLDCVGWFPVTKGNGMGTDEIFLCNLATTQSKAMIISETCVVGHLSFGKQNEEMRNYYLQNGTIFDIKK